MLYVPPRIEAPDVAAAFILDPFSNSIDPLFHSLTPCLRNAGKYSKANCKRDITWSLAVSALLARIAILTSSLNSAYQRRYAVTVVVLPCCRGNLHIVNLFSSNVL